MNRPVLLFLLTALAAAGFFAAASAGFLSAQEQEGAGDDTEEEPEPELGVLLRGPLIKKGIPFLYPNAIPVFYGEYEYQDAGIIIYFTEEEIVRSDTWKSFECPERTLYRISRQDRLVLFLQSPEGWSLFFSMPEDLETSCRFIDKFLERFVYFRSITRDRNIATFPAVLEF